MKHTLVFTTGETLQVEEQRKLSELLDVLNSPVLFGCRTGICATCMVRVVDGMDHLPPLTEDEQEVVEVYDGDEQCRLACQLYLKGDVTLTYVGK